MTDAFGFLLALAVSAAAIPALVRAAPGWGLMAHPGAHKAHSGAVPAVGGLAMGAAFLAAYVLCFRSGDMSPALLAAIAVTLAGGVMDDRHELGSMPKFAFQVLAAAVLAAWGGTLLTDLGLLMSGNLFTLGRWSLALTIFAIVGVMNAFNMADGLDGLAGSLALVACLGYGFAAATTGDAALFTLICLTAGALLGFLVWNARTPWRGAAQVYMGDTGSLLLGLLLAWIAIRLAAGERPGLAPITAVWIVGLPIADTLTLMLRRALRGKNPFRADREHLHHILLALGLSSGKVVATLFFAAVLLASAGLAAEASGVPEHFMFYAYMAGLVLYGLTAEFACRRLQLRDAK